MASRFSQRQEEMKREYPEKVIESFDGVHIHYLHKKGNKTPVIFLHGLSGQYGAWEPFYTHLHNNNHEVLSIDLRGHGFSDKPKNSKAYTVKHAVSDLEHILDAEKINECIIVAHCYGSYIGLMYAQKNPKRVKKMLLVSPNYKPGTHWIYTLVLLPYLGFLKLLGFIYRKEYYEKIDFTKMRGITDFDIPKVLQLYKIASTKTMYEFSKDIRKYDFKTIASQIHTPTHIIAGEKDIIVPVSLGKELQQLMPNATITIYKGVNHQPTLNAWQRFRDDLTKFVQT